MSKTISKASVCEILADIYPTDGEKVVAVKEIDKAYEAILQLPSAKPEQPTEVQDILQYLDEYLHPIVSPEHWEVYSELYDMISCLPSAQPERKKGKWIRKERNRGGFRLYTGIDELGETHTIQVDERTHGHDLYCSECGKLCSDVSLNFCSNCGSYNGGNEE